MSADGGGIAMRGIVVLTLLAFLVCSSHATRVAAETETEGGKFGGFSGLFGGSDSKGEAEPKPPKPSPLERAKSLTSLDGLKESVKETLQSAEPLLNFGNKDISYGDTTGCVEMSSSDLAAVCKAKSGQAVTCVSGKKCCGPLGDKGHGCVFMTFRRDPEEVWVTAGVDTKKYGVFQARILEKTPEELLESIAAMVAQPVCMEPLGLWGAALEQGSRALETAGVIDQSRVGRTEVCIQFAYDRLAASAKSFGTVHAHLFLKGNCKGLEGTLRPFGTCNINCSCSRKSIFGGNSHKYACTDCDETWNCAATKGGSGGSKPAQSTGSVMAQVSGAFAAKKCVVCKQCSGCRNGECSRCLSCDNCDLCELEAAKHSEACTLFQCMGPYHYDLPRSIFASIAGAEEL